MFDPRTASCKEYPQRGVVFVRPCCANCGNVPTVQQPRPMCCSSVTAAGSGPRLHYRCSSAAHLPGCEQAVTTSFPSSSFPSSSFLSEML